MPRCSVPVRTTAPGSVPCPFSGLLIPIGQTMNIPRTRGSSLCPPSPVADTPGPPLCLLFLHLALLLPHHLWVACHGQGLKLSSSRPIITTAPLYPSALPCGISLPTCPSSLSCRHRLILKGTWEVQYCCPAPGLQEPLHTALPS